MQAFLVLDYIHSSLQSWRLWREMKILAVSRMSSSSLLFMIDEISLDAHTYGAFTLAYGVGNAGNVLLRLFDS